MKNTFLKEKFKKVNFVKPLYRKVKSAKVRPKKLLFSIDIDNKTNLRGNGINVKRVTNAKHGDIDLISSKHIKEAITHNDSNINKFNINKEKLNNGFLKRNMLTSELDKEIQESETNRSVQANNKHEYLIRGNSWLRVYPAPFIPGESIFSIIFRCIVCQLGLASFLMLWTLLWVFVIQLFEGPNESKISKDFENKQNQLVIDLATELRQITPISSKWKHAIQKRIEEERTITMLAISRGAKLHPGQYWDLTGTFLFTIYVMTALGFGAPVPQTIWGRTAALIYAGLAVPTHFYLMIQTSTCLVAKIDSCIRRWNKKLNSCDKMDGANTEQKTESPNCSRNSELMKAPHKSMHRKLCCLIKIVCAGRGVPLAAVLYYACGLVAFGLVRGKEDYEVAMFPLEFTTSGGLEHVEGYVRILYGIYVEGAVMLLACALATIRRHSSSAANSTSEHYRLFVFEDL